MAPYLHYVFTLRKSQEYAAQAASPNATPPTPLPRGQPCSYPAALFRACGSPLIRKMSHVRPRPSPSGDFNSGESRCTARGNSHLNWTNHPCSAVQVNAIWSRGLWRSGLENDGFEGRATPSIDDDCVFRLCLCCDFGGRLRSAHFAFWLPWCLVGAKFDVSHPKYSEDGQYVNHKC
jgi:hypothetical protein